MYAIHEASLQSHELYCDDPNRLLLWLGRHQLQLKLLSCQPNNFTRAIFMDTALAIIPWNFERYSLESSYRTRYNRRDNKCASTRSLSFSNERRHLSIKLKVSFIPLWSRAPLLFITEAEKGNPYVESGVGKCNCSKPRVQSFLAGGLPLQAESRACAAPCADSFAYIMHVYSYGSSCGRVQRASLEGGVALPLPLLRAMKEGEGERNADWTFRWKHEKVWTDDEDSDWQ